MTAIDAAVPEKRQVRSAFARAAAHYDRYADLQRRTGESLLARLDAPDRVRVLVDIGCGTGYFLPKLAERFPDAVPLALDLTEAMLYQAGNRLPRGHRICADAEALPLADECADLLYSNLVLQWCATLGRALREFARVLRSGGVAAFSLFGMDTLQELRLAWREVDEYPRVNDFIAVDALLRQVRSAGLTVVDVRQCHECSAYASVRELMRELKGLGAHNVLDTRPRHLTGKSALARMESAYVRQMGGGAIRATYETIGIVVRKP